MNQGIITTIGPASDNKETLQFFKDHGVQIARLNFSHGTPDSHRAIAQLCREVGLKIMFDLAGPKILLGTLDHSVEIQTGSKVVLEHVKDEQIYPYTLNDKGADLMVLPCQFKIDDFVDAGKSIYIDDGKIKLNVIEIRDGKVFCDIIDGALVKSNKGVNIPGTDPKIDFIVDRDRHFLAELYTEIRPDLIAVSFVRYASDIELIQSYLQELNEAHNVQDNYMAGICTKIEQAQAVMGENFRGILEKSDMIMVARGDLALETEPTHIKVPFYQKQLVELCKTNQTPVVVATQMLESMMGSQVPTRAEVSDVYRAVVVDQADYIMLSGESAAGQYPHEAVKFMHDMISQHKELEQQVKKELGSALPVRITFKQGQVS